MFVFSSPRLLSILISGLSNVAQDCLGASREGELLCRGMMGQPRRLPQIQGCTKAVFLLDVNHNFKGMSIYPEACSNVICIMVNVQGFYTGHKVLRFLSLCNKYPGIYFTCRTGITKGTDEVIA